MTMCLAFTRTAWGNQLLRLRLIIMGSSHTAPLAHKVVSMVAAKVMRTSIAVCLVSSISAYAQDKLVLKLSCTFNAMYSVSDNLYVTRNQMKDGDTPRVFSITAGRAGEDGSSGQYSIGKTSAIGLLAGDFTFLFEPRIVEWQETDGDYYFRTLAVNEVYHGVFIDRLKGSLTHYFGTHKVMDNGVPDTLTYEYVDCIPQKVRF
jgi:hypothetical protein